MLLNLCWFLLILVNIRAESVYSYVSQYGSEAGNLAEAERNPGLSELLAQKVSCSGEEGQCKNFDVVSREEIKDPSLQVARYDASGSPVFDSSLQSSHLITGSNFVQNLQLVVHNEKDDYDPNDPRIVSYGPVYRLRKPQGAHSSSRTVPSGTYKHPVSSATSESVPNDQDGYKAGFSHVGYDAAQLRDAYKSVSAVVYSKNKPSLSSLVSSSGPLIKFTPNRSNYLLSQTINRTQHSYEAGSSVKPLVTTDQSTTETYKPFAHSQGINYQRLFLQQVPKKIRYLSPQPINGPINALKPHLASKNPLSGTTELRFAQVGNTYSLADPIYNHPSAFKPAQMPNIQQIARPVHSRFSHDVVYETHYPAVSLTGSAYRFTRPSYAKSLSTGTLMDVPSSSTKTLHSNYMKHFYQAGLPEVKSLPPEVTSGNSRYGFAQSENTYTSSYQPDKQF